MIDYQAPKMVTTDTLQREATGLKKLSFEIFDEPNEYKLYFYSQELIRKSRETLQECTFKHQTHWCLLRELNEAPMLRVLVLECPIGSP